MSRADLARLLDEAPGEPLAAVLIAGHDVLVLDEPTNHLDVEVIGWLAESLGQIPVERRTARARESIATAAAALIVAGDRAGIVSLAKTSNLWQRDGVASALQGAPATALAFVDGVVGEDVTMNVRTRRINVARVGDPVTVLLDSVTVKTLYAAVAPVSLPVSGYILKGSAKVTVG